MTAELLGVDDQGTPGAGATPTNAQLTIPGYDDEWFDVKSKQTTVV